MHGNKLMINIIVWMNLTDTMLSKRSQTVRGTHLKDYICMEFKDS